MAVAPGSFLAAVLLLVSSGLHRSSSLPPCPDSCSCQRAPLLNCSSSGLSSVPQHIPDSVTELDLSRNLLDSVALDRPRRDLRRVWLGNNRITHLSLCIEGNLGGHYVRRRRLKHGLRPWRGRGCVSWAPTLQLLSVERNQLAQLPQGLEGSESLQVLLLSFNRISTLRPGELNHLQQLKELHLQHNLITNLHPQMFQDLAQLQVLDLSFNMLTSLHPLTYLSLRSIGADVVLGGNRWQCDCSMRSLRRRMAYDSSRGQQTWSVVCASPSILSGRDLLQLEEDDLSCFSPENGPELHQDVTVYKGSEILLSCTTQDSVWWTPSSQAPVSQPQAGLVISDITETETGLYVCVSEEYGVVSVFNLQISNLGGARRKARSLPRTSQIIPQGIPNRTGQERNQRTTQSNMALAVCLSVFITFLIAFILGVLARPCIDALWGRVTKKKRASATNSSASVEQRQYDNEAYFDGEGPEHMGPHRERRVTFSTIDFREDSNVKYYDTVAGGNQGRINNDAVIECEGAEVGRDTNTAGDSGSEKSVRQSSPENNLRDGRDLSGVTDTGHLHNVDFEHIPDPVELVKRRSLSSCSGSSLSDKVFNENQMTQGDHSTPKTPQLAEDSVQQRADSLSARNAEVPQISIEGKSEPPGFSSEPFADWSSYTNNTNLTDMWQENEEQFEFSDSVRSTSARSSGVLGSSNESKLIVAPSSDKQKTYDISSSSSYVSDDEPTQYIVNLVHDEEDIERNHNKPEVSNAVLNQGASFEQQIHGVDPTTPLVGFNQGDTQRSTVRPEDSFSSHFSDSDDYRVKKEHVPSLAVIIQNKSLDTRAPPPPGAYSSSSSSESEAEITNLNVKHNTGININEPETLSTDMDRQFIPQIKTRVDINVLSPASDSSSSDESMDKTTNHTKQQERVGVNMAGLPSKEHQSVSHHDMKPQWAALGLDHPTPIKRRLDISAPSPPTDSSSSSDSEDETTHHIEKQNQGATYIATVPVEVSQNVRHDPQPQWPALDLEDTTHVKSCRDLKAPSPPDSSSSSDNEDETTHFTDRPGKVDIAGLPFPESQTGSHDPHTRWPVVDLEDTTRVKKRLDIKAPLSPLDSSSSSDSEDETPHHTQKPGKVDNALLFQESQTRSHDPDTRGPVVDLEHTTRVKRRLDIKALSPPDSSSSSDSDDEPRGHIKKQEKEQMNMDKAFQNKSLEDTMRIKTRLDVKAPSPLTDSSPSSDSDDETGRTVKQSTGKVDIAGFPLKESQTRSHDSDIRFPALDLEDTMRIKRRLDVKAPLPPSSSSSDSEDETTHQIKQQKQGAMYMASLPVEVSQNSSHDTQPQWPALDLEDTTRVKKRLDIKAPSPPLDSSSSSDSEDETTHHTQKPGKMDNAGLPFQESQTRSHDPNTRWPLVDLEHTTCVKRRLDIKAPSPPYSSSSSDSQDETTHPRERPGKVDIAGLPFQESQTGSHDPHTRWPVIDLEDATRIKRHLDIKAPSPASYSSSSSDSNDDPRGHIKKQEQEQMNMDKASQNKSLEDTMRIKTRLDVKAPSPLTDSSPTSDSDDETTGRTEKQSTGKVDIAGFPLKESQTRSHDSDIRFPALDLEDTMRIKRRLDVKAPLPPSSSSSDSEDETTHQIKQQKQGAMYMASLPVEVSQNSSHDTQPQWPALDLEDTTRVKKRLDIKAPSPPLDSSSSSDSEDETTHHTQKPGKMDNAGLPFQESQTRSHDPNTRWPLVDLEHTTCVKRRLDIKAPSPPYSSSSSDSQDETTHPRERPGKVDIAGLPFQESQTGSHDPHTRWPVIDLEDATRIKRHLDIKAPSPASYSSSSSDSNDDPRGHIKKQEQEQMNMDKASQNKSLEDTMRIKTRLDVKAPSPLTDSSPTSDSDDETTGRTEKQSTGKVDIAGFPLKESQTRSHDPDARFPALDLEDTMRIKRRLDVKAPLPPSSSSSDSEDETTHQIKKQKQGAMYMASLPVEVSQNASHDTQPQWPALDLEDITHVKKRLDIKAPSPPLDSSSSSDSEDETTHHRERPGKVDIAGLPLQESQTRSRDPHTRSLVVDLEHTTRIKRRLDIKAPTPPPDSSSSSDSGDETKIERPGMVRIAQLPYQEKISHDPDMTWPSIALEHIPRIKRRLDLKPTPPSHGSFLSGGSTNRTVEGKTGESIKISPCHSSSHSDEQEEGLEDLRYTPTTVDPDSRWPRLDLSSALHVKRRLDIKACSPPRESSSRSDHEHEGGMTNLPVKVETKLSVGVPYINRRLDIKAPLPQPRPFLGSVSPGSRQSESNSSRSDSEDEYRDCGKIEMEVSATSKVTEKEFIRSPKTPMINIAPKTDIKLEKYIAISDEVGDKTTNNNISTTPEINPELQSRWATMNLGISRFRKRLEITSHTHEPPNLPSTPPPDSSSSSSSESGAGSKSSRTRRTRWRAGGDDNSGHSAEAIERVRKDYSLPTSEEKSNPHTKLTGTPHLRRYIDFKVHEKAPASPPQVDQTHSQTGMQRKAGVELKSQASKLGEESYSVQPHLSLTNIPHIRRALDIRAPSQRESSASSNSEDEKLDHSVPDLSLGVPRITRRLNIKAPSPEPSNSASSCSDSENQVTEYTVNQSRHASNMSRMTDEDSLITYKRVIMKASLPQSSSHSLGGKGQTVDHTRQRHMGTEMQTKKVTSMNFDDVVKKRLEQPRSTTDVDLPPEIKWTGVGRQLSDLPIPSARRHLGVGLLAPPAEPELPPPDSSNSSSSESDDNIKQDRGKAGVPLMHKHSSLGAHSVSLAPSRSLDKFDSPPSSTNEISRAVSENRNERKGLSALKAMSSERRKWDTDENFDVGASPLFDDHGQHGDGKGIRPLTKQPLTQLDRRRATDLLYDIPNYRRHDIGGIQPPMGAPPPIQATPPPPPYEAVRLTWRSPQSSNKAGVEGTRSYQSKNTEESDGSPLPSQKLAVHFDSSSVNISEV